MIYRHFDQSQMELGVFLDTGQQLSIRILPNKFVISQNQYIMETIFSFVSQPREFFCIDFYHQISRCSCYKVADRNHSPDPLQWLYRRGLRRSFRNKFN